METSMGGELSTRTLFDDEIATTLRCRDESFSFRGWKAQGGRQAFDCVSAGKGTAPALQRGNRIRAHAGAFCQFLLRQCSGQAAVPQELTEGGGFVHRQLRRARQPSIPTASGRRPLSLAWYQSRHG